MLPPDGTQVGPIVEQRLYRVVRKGALSFKFHLVTESQNAAAGRAMVLTCQFIDGTTEAREGR